MDNKEMEGIDLDALAKELESLGVNKYVIQQKDSNNLSMAKKIVEDYDFGRDLKPREKGALIQRILDKRPLNQERTRYLATLIKRLRELGFTEQEAYGLIINLAVRGSILKEPGYGYSDLLLNNNNVCQTLGDKIEAKDTAVSYMTILKAVGDTLSEEEEKALRSELQVLGIHSHLIKQRSAENLYMAKSIVENYDFGIPLTQEEKKAILQAILDSSELNRRPGNNLFRLMHVFYEIGLNEQEIYGGMINLSVHGKAIKEPGYEYNNLLANSEGVRETLLQHKDGIDTEVSGITILTAMSKSVEEAEEQRLKEELEKLGIMPEFIRNKDKSNLYLAKWIVDNCKIGRELIIGEKRDIIQCILNSTKLDTKEHVYLYKLIHQLEKIGFDEQEICGAIINFGVNGILIGTKTYSYNELMSNESGILTNIGDYAGQIKTNVTKGTIANSLNKSEKIMRKAAKRQKAKGAIGKMTDTRANLESLVRQEIAQDNVAEQEQG